MTPRQLRSALRTLEQQERDEVEEVAKDIRDKYHKLKKELKDKCDHKWQLNLEYGVCPWDVWYYCPTCSSSKYERDEQVYRDYRGEEE